MSNLEKLADRVLDRAGEAVEQLLRTPPVEKSARCPWCGGTMDESYHVDRDLLKALEELKFAVTRLREARS